MNDVSEEHYRIDFSRPDLDALSAEYTVVDLHFHSRYSDGQNDIPSIAKRARKLGIGIAVTDHNTITGALELSSYTDILTIPGIEVTAKEGAHVLVYFYELSDLILFYEKDLGPYLGKEVMSSVAMSMEAVVACARKYKSLVVFPHPYCTAYTGICNPVYSKRQISELLSMADGVEVINASNLHRWNLESALLGFNMETGLTAGSDGHSLSYLGRAVTYAPVPGDRAAFLDAVRDKHTWVVGKEINIIRKVTSNSRKIRSNIRNSQDLLEKNVRYGYAVIHGASRRVREGVKKRIASKVFSGKTGR